MTAPELIRVLRVGRHVARRLGSGPAAAARVHSVFERAANLRWHDGRLVALHGPGPLLAPFALALERLPRAGALAVGADARREGTRLFLGDVVLDWRDAEAATTSVGAAGRVDGAAGAVLLGAAPAARGRMPGARARRLLADGIRRAEARAFIAGARGLIGLGEGLTPSGDDVLVGALAALHRFRRQFLARRPSIRTALAAAVRDGTTDVGREFILHALDGAFSEVVTAVLTARSGAAARSAARRLLDTGATSGADTLAGIRLACRALAA